MAKFSVGDRVCIYKVGSFSSDIIRSYEGKIGVIEKITPFPFPVECRFEDLESPHDLAGFLEKELALLLADTKINRKLYPDAKLVDGYLMVRSEDV